MYLVNTLKAACMLFSLTVPLVELLAFPWFTQSRIIKKVCSAIYSMHASSRDV